MIYQNPAYSPENRTEHLLSLMTIEEKAFQLTSVWSHEIMSGTFECDLEKMKRKYPLGIGGITRLGGATPNLSSKLPRLYNEMQQYFVEHTRLKIPALFHEESCCGAMYQGATNFPQTIGIAATFNTDICSQMADVIGQELREIGARQALAPLLDICRDARWGRVEESFGEDPYLTSQMGISYIKGIQKNNILATGKHFIGYGASESALNCSPVYLSERRLREVYFPPFEAAIQEAGLKCIMPSYQENDGVPCHASKFLLNKVLRQEWGFKGLVVTDYAGLDTLYGFHHIFEDKNGALSRAIECEIDMELPIDSIYGAFLANAIIQGKISEEKVNRLVSRVLLEKFRLGLFDHPYIQENPSNIRTEASKALSLEAARESLVLLENNNILPMLEKKYKIAVIGPNADCIRHQFGDYAYIPHLESLMKRFQKIIAGEREDLEFSSEEAESALQRIKELETTTDGVSVFEGLSLLNGHKNTYYSLGSTIFETSEELLQEAEQTAKQADVIIAVLGDRAGVSMLCSSGESRDRQHLSLPSAQKALLDRLLACETPVILVLIHGRPIVIPKHKNLSAVLASWLPGEYGGMAIAETLFGRYNPGGKLPITFPQNSGQTPIYYASKISNVNAKGFVDGKMTPLYPFGYGLSYTTFDITDFQVSAEKILPHESLDILCSIANTGNMDGSEVVQLYFTLHTDEITRPIKELKGFKRIFLKKGDVKKICFEVPIDILAFYNENMEYILPSCAVDIQIGVSSEKIICSKTIYISKSALILNKKYTTSVKVYK